MAAPAGSLSRLRALVVCGTASLVLLGGCASTGDPRDPFEPLNRGIYKFNDGVDHLIVRPAAEIYRGVLPAFARTGISNFFSNLNDVIIALNNLLQGKFANGVSDVGRIVVNTTVGILGVFDVATEIGLEKHNEDFGQTLGRWGLGSGPYLVIPLLGPSSFRDAVGLVGDWKSNPLTYVDPNSDRNALLGVSFVGRRSELLEASDILQTAALDPYEFLRDAYLQRRRNLVYDGNPPDEIDIENDTKPRQESSDASPFPSPMESSPGSAVVGRDFQPTPAEIDARERTPAAAPAPRPPAPRAADPARPARVVRVWLPFSRN